MAEDTEYKKLTVEERCVHKLWKARVDGYEEAAKIFREADDEKAPEWSKFSSLIKKMVVDSHALAQEKGLEAALIYTEKCGNAGRTVGDVVSGIIQKAIAAPKAKTKELSVQIILMYIEIEKHETVLEELIKGMDHKNPKIVAACVATTNLALRDFGHKVINVKPLIKKLTPLLSDRDKTVRDETKQLASEIFRWIGSALKPQIASLPQVTLKDLEDEFEKVKNERAEPTRYLRSQQEQQEHIADVYSGESAPDDVEKDNDKEEIDPMDLLDPTDILSKMPKDFYEKLDEKKWSLRKESLDALEKLLTENPKLESGDYGALVNALRKVITKDSNVVLVALAGKCLAMLAKGLGKRFSPYAMACIPCLLEKFKEKKANVVAALREAVDCIYPSTNVEALQECIVESLSNKNPSVKSETAQFLARSFARTQPASLNKKLTKLLVTALIKTLNEPDPTARDSSAEALGTLLKLLGEKTVGPLLIDVEALKLAKIKEFQEKAEIKVKCAVPKKERPATAPESKPASNYRNVTADTKSKGSRPVTSTTRKVLKKPATTTAPAASNAEKGPTANIGKTSIQEREMTPEEIQDKAEELFPGICASLADANWKNRLAAVENLYQQLNTFDAKTPGLSQIIVRTVSGQKPGLKDMNFQVLKIKLDIIRLVAESFQLSIVTVDSVINEIIEKLADGKNGTAAADVLTAFAESTKLEIIVSKVLSFALEQRSPKIQSEALNWVNKAIIEFGLQLQPKCLLEDVRKGVKSTNPVVRGAAITLIGTLSMYMGNTLLVYFDSEKQALKSQIETEFDKNAQQKPPKPVRGIKRLVGGNEAGIDFDCNIDEEKEFYDAEETPTTVNDLSGTRVDIAPLITESLLKEMSDREWKTRNIGLNKLQSILTESKLIKPTIGDLAPALAHRLVDSNAKIAQTALSICDQLANAMGAGCKQYVRTLFPGFLHALGDNKSFVRAAAMNCINSFGEQGGYKEFFESEMIADALKSGPPALKSELWAWLAERLPLIPPKAISKDELMSIVPYLYAHICDRNADVRKNANEAVLGVMMHVGFDTLTRLLDKQRPATKKDIQAALDKARPNLPIKPLPKGKQQAPILAEPKKVVRGGGQKIAASKVEKLAPAAAHRKKEEEIDTSPLLAINNTKNQRLIDEQKMRVLKWNFTTPREEFTDLLRDQMTAANVNKGLMANMFHDDFRYHLKVLEQLSNDLPYNSEALKCNLDLILKWLTLRFYDTNPSVLIKGLEYLENVFKTLAELEYILADNEGSSFVPHLLLKLGDSKDTVRNGVRNVLRHVIQVFPYTKVFSYVMDGLKSKNARQRTECLDELSFLIESYGLTICQPSQQVALKEIARQISDRDNSVRNAALNCIVQAYFLAGEKIYKLIGQINEKDLSMLDERIKRAKKTRKPSPALVEPTRATARPESEEVEELPPPNVIDELPLPDEERNHDTTQTVISHQPQLPQKSSGPFGLDPDVIADIEKGWIRADQLEPTDVQAVDITILFEPIKVIPTREGIQYPQVRFDHLIARSRHMQQTHSAITPPTTALRLGNAPAYNGAPRQLEYNGNSPKFTEQDPQLLKLINAVSSTDTLKARAAINELREILETPEKQAVLCDYEEVFIQNVLAQMKNLSKVPIAESYVVYQPLLSILYTFFHAKTLGKTLSAICIKDLMSALLTLMADPKLTGGDDSQYNKVINGICLKVLDKANFTNLNCALIRLLQEKCLNPGFPKFTDLLMKCIWRNVKMLPERSDELNYNAVILEVHEFMAALSPTWWKNRPSDTPLRTVKTIIHNMAKVKGFAILQYLHNVPNDSELHLYLSRILKNLEKDGHIPGSSSQRTSNAINDTMSQIFKLVSNKETEQQGLQKLYDFKLKNPDVDLSTFLQGTKARFQRYIEEGLAEIEKSRGGCGYQSAAGGNSVMNVGYITNLNQHINQNDIKNPDVYLDRLQQLRMQANLPQSSNLSCAKSHLVDNKALDENICMNSLNTQQTSLNANTTVNPLRYQQLQAKLSQIKKDNL